MCHPDMLTYPFPVGMGPIRVKAISRMVATEISHFAMKKTGEIYLIQIQFSTMQPKLSEFRILFFFFPFYFAHKMQLYI